MSSPSESLPPELAAPCILMVAPNGARRTRADHPKLPLSAEEIAAEAPAWRMAGAAALHLHARDAEGRHSIEPELYRRYLDLVERATGGALPVQVTTEAAGRYTLTPAGHAAVAAREAAVPGAAIIHGAGGD